MKITLLNKGLFYSLLFVFFLLSGCSKDDVELSNAAKIQGTWNVQSFVIADETETIDFFSFLAAFEPCIKENRISFTADGNFTASVPSDCVNEDGESLLIFPASETGSYTITEEGKLTITDIDGDYQGDFTFETNDKLILTTVEEDAEITVTFVRI